jgi:two-component system, NtrC family, nitrogen regulation sensor histidine kinase NtrY
MIKLENMNSSQFNYRVTLQVILIALTSGLFLWAIGQENKLVTSVSLIFLWMVQIWLLIRYVNTTNQQLLLFLQSFQFDDSSIVFNKQKKLAFREIYREFNRIIEQFRDLKIEKEIEHQYFEHVIKHVETGLVAWDKNEKVHLLNQAAKRILQIPHVSALQGFRAVQEDLPYRLKNLIPGQEELLKIYEGNEIKNLHIRASEFNIRGTKIKLVSFQNIRPELEEKEAEAWQRLIKVLTHEIVNSVSPIKLVSSSLMRNLAMDNRTRKPEELSGEEIENIYSGLKAIYSRSQGLSRFVDDYKTVTEIPRPDIVLVPAGELISEVIALSRRGQPAGNIEWIADIRPSDLTIPMDKKMVGQILINLVKNASNALDDHSSPRIIFRAYEDAGRKRIEVSDNGTGIPFNILDYIFMPFFTTKKNGSGIGLTLSRQLMKAQKGQLKIYSKEGEGTTVTLIF